MTVSEIEAEARAYVEAYLERFSGADDQCFRYLVAMFKIIDKLRAPPGADAAEHARRMSASRPPLVLGNPQIFAKTSRAQLEHDALALQQYGDERAAAAIDGILYWRKMALELKAELATARETPATAPGPGSSGATGLASVGCSTN